MNVATSSRTRNEASEQEGRLPGQKKVTQPASQSGSIHVWADTLKPSLNLGRVEGPDASVTSGHVWADWHPSKPVKIWGGYGEVTGPYWPMSGLTGTR